MLRKNVPMTWLWMWADLEEVDPGKAKSCCFCSWKLWSGAFERSAHIAGMQHGSQLGRLPTVTATGNPQNLVPLDISLHLLTSINQRWTAPVTSCCLCPWQNAREPMLLSTLGVGVRVLVVEWRRWLPLVDVGGSVWRYMALMMRVCLCMLRRRLFLGRRMCQWKQVHFDRLAWLIVLELAWCLFGTHPFFETK